ncbi:MAG: TonB-dependent receptor [Pseudomonadota bacterium]
MKRIFGQRGGCRTSISSAAVGAILIFLGAPTAAAQADATDVDERVEIENDDTIEEEARQERIIVTGSLLAQSEFTSSSALQVITADIATIEGLVDTASLLQSSSLATGATQLNNTFQSFVTNGGVGTQTIDLRGCGDTRTLVLVNGKRWGPSGTRGAVSSFDLNSIPQSMISRIEILKDGASTIYGSDAVCGVVSIITRTDIDQPELNLSYSQPFESGGEEMRLSGAYGFDIGDNADFTLGAEFRLSSALNRGDRPWLECNRDYVSDFETGASRDRLNFSATAKDPNDNCGNLYHNTVIDALVEAELDTDQRLVPSSDGSTEPTILGGSIPGYVLRASGGPTNGTGMTEDGALFYTDIVNADFLDEDDVRPENENISLFASADIEIAGMSWDTDVLYNKRITTQDGHGQFFPIIGSNINAAANNPLYGYVNFDYDNGFNSLVRPVYPLRRTAKTEIDYYAVSSSLSGGYDFELLADWSWKVDGTWSLGQGSYRTDQIRASLSADWGIDGVQDTNGDGVADFVSAPTWDVFDPSILSGENMSVLTDAIVASETGQTDYEQTTFTAVTSGDLFTLPAGDVSLALGAEYRAYSIEDTPGHLTLAGDVWGRSTSGITEGENSVSELFAELAVPVFKGQPFAEDVQLSVSARAFRYDIGGEDAIYRAGLNWQMNPVFRFRTSYNTSYRAPALYELFLDEQTGFQSYGNVDPCILWEDSNNPNVRANCAALGIPEGFSPAYSSSIVTTSGGADVLEPETSETFTAGIVITPADVGLNIALDYFEIEIEDQITSLSAGTITSGCYGLAQFPNAFCNQFTREGADSTTPFRVNNIRASYLNVNSQNQRGLDLELRYVQDLELGELTIESSMAWSFERIVNLFGADFIAGVENNDFNGRVGYPYVSGDLLVQLERGDWTYSFFSDYVGRQDNNSQYRANLDGPLTYQGIPGARYKGYTEATMYHGASIQWEGDTWTFSGGVRNVFDEAPPAVSSTVVSILSGTTPLYATSHDLLGRRAFMSVQKRF